MKEIFYNIPLGNKKYCLSDKSVDKLIQIKEQSEKQIETTIELKNGEVITGEIVKIEGYNPLVPYDEFIPLEFQINYQNSIRKILFTEIKL